MSGAPPSIMIKGTSSAVRQAGDAEYKGSTAGGNDKSGGGSQHTGPSGGPTSPTGHQSAEEQQRLADAAAAYQRYSGKA